MFSRIIEKLGDGTLETFVQSVLGGNIKVSIAAIDMVFFKLQKPTV